MRKRGGREEEGGGRESERGVARAGGWRKSRRGQKVQGGERVRGDRYEESETKSEEGEKRLRSSENKKVVQVKLPYSWKLSLVKTFANC